MELQSLWSTEIQIDEETGFPVVPRGLIPYDNDWMGFAWRVRPVKALETWLPGGDRLAVMYTYESDIFLSSDFHVWGVAAPDAASIRKAAVKALAKRIKRENQRIKENNEAILRSQHLSAKERAKIKKRAARAALRAKRHAEKYAKAHEPFVGVYPPKKLEI